MKRILMLKPRECGSGDTTERHVYQISEDILEYQFIEIEDGKEYIDWDTCEYTEENILKYKDTKCKRWITIKDNSSEDSFEVYENEDRFIIFETDRELAHALIDNINGLDTTIVSLASYFMHN